MATATHTGPIGIDQINSTFIVYGASGGFDTIQAAVDFVRTYNSGVGEIVIAHGHGYGEEITTLTGGTVGIFIIDQRDGADQRWHWVGTGFLPMPFDQLGPYITRGPAAPTINAVSVGFEPTGAQGNGRGDIRVEANQGTGMPAIQLQGQPKDGGSLHTFFRGDADPVTGFLRVQMPQTLWLNSDATSNMNLWLGQNFDINISKGMYIWAKPNENLTELQACQAGGIYDQSIYLNYRGGDVVISPNGKTTVGQLEITTDLVLGHELHAYGGIETPVIVIGQMPGNQAGNKVVYIGTGPDTNTCEIQAVTRPGTYDQTLQLNPLGGNVNIGSGVTIDYAGNLAVTGRSDLAVIHAHGDMQLTGTLSMTGDTHQTGDFYLAGNAFMGRLTAVEIAGSTPQGGTAPITIIGDGHVTGDWLVDDHLSANSAAFTTCLVDNSPVRTFANSQDGGGTMEWPPAGIGVSTGTAWSATSIDPATVPRVTPAGDMTIAGNMLAHGFIAQSSSTLNRIVIGNSGGIGYVDFQGPDNATQGVGYFRTYKADGSGLKDSMHITEPSLDIFTPVNVGSGNTIFDLAGNGNFKGRVTVGPNAAANIHGDAPGTNLTINSPAGLALNFESGQIIYFGDGASGVAATLDHTGTASFNGSITTHNGDARFTGPLGVTTTVHVGEDAALSGQNGELLLQFVPNTGNGNYGIGKIGATKSGVAWADMQICGNGGSLSLATPGNYTTVQGALNIGANLIAYTYTGSYQGAGKAAIRSNDSVPALALSPGKTNATMDFGIDSQFATDQSGTYNFWSGPNASSVQSQILILTRQGNATFAGTVTAAGKSFRIPHPLDETKDLVHSCLEGPEWGVYYRGETTTANGIAEVTLPDYFEALTFPEDRTVLLTVIVDDDNPVFGAGQIAAGRVKDGKFKVYSSDPSVTIAWEVKAIRRFGEERLKVVAEKAPFVTIQNPPEVEA